MAGEVRTGYHPIASSQLANSDVELLMRTIFDAGVSA
jgi:hypothetical protein